MTDTPRFERRIITYSPDFRFFLESFVRPIALVSPAIFDILGEKVNLQQLEQAFRSIGFSELRTISFSKYNFIECLIREATLKKDGPVLFSACPLARALVAAEYPDMLGLFTKATPPADRAAAAARKECPDATLFWFAPCSARSMPLLGDADTEGPFVDYLIPLHTAFPALLEALGIPAASIEAYCGACGAASGQTTAAGGRMRVVATPDSIRQYLDRLARGAERATGIVELIACPSGCSDGDWAPNLREKCAIGGSPGAMRQTAQ